MGVKKKEGEGEMLLLLEKIDDAKNFEAVKKIFAVVVVVVVVVGL